MVSPGKVVLEIGVLIAVACVAAFMVPDALTVLSSPAVWVNCPDVIQKLGELLLPIAVIVILILRVIQDVEDE